MPSATQFIALNQISSHFLHAASPDEATSNWESFLKNLATDPKSLPLSFVRLFGNSRFLCRFLIQNPDQISVVNSPYLAKLKEYQLFISETRSIVASSPSPISSLKKYKYSELLRITLKDLSGGHDLAVLRELSYLAHALLRAISDLEYANLKQRFGTPLNNDGIEPAFHYLALGKLGGLELNYSSDIDLLAITETDEGSCGELSLSEFYVKLAQNLTKTMQSRDETGFFYRVDWDLRPEGKSGSLVNSISSLETYYETFGAEWQRQVFTKASPGSGSELLGKQFIEAITPFSYRKNFDIDSIRRLQDMKEQIHDSIQSSLAKGFNVKLGKGGIRDIEFFAQAFLMVFGGRKPQIRDVSTIEVISKLCKERFISNETEHDLLESYYFLRRLENKLQMVDEEQTHLLRSEPGEMLAVARRMGYRGTPDEVLSLFTNDLEKVRTHVSSIFDGLFKEKKSFQSAPPFSMVATDSFAESVRPNLLGKLSKQNDFEFKLEQLRLFKKETFELILKEDKLQTDNRQLILKKLSLTAEMIVQEALAMAQLELAIKYGQPTIEDQPTDLAHFVVLGMGKLGGNEINYLSDLDMIFIYSHNGETNGARKITNNEYYVRLVQKLISILMVPTRSGIAYEVDTELRPSGHKGTLVTSLDSFLEYQNKVSSIWERQALIRANPIAGSSHLARIVSEHITSLLYAYPMPKGIKKEMHKLRSRVVRELAKEDTTYFDYKLGKGGLMDIEYILQYYQLLQGSQDPSLRSRNTFDGLERLLKIIPKNKKSYYATITDAYSFFRTLESVVTLEAGRRLHRIRRDSPLLGQVSAKMNLSHDQLIHQIDEFKQLTRVSYRETFNIKAGIKP